MRNITLITLIIILTATACKQERKCFDKNDELSKIENVLEHYVIANENRDFDMIEKIWATDDDIVLIGTHAKEKLIGWEQIQKAIKKQYSEFEDTYISVIEQKITINDSGTTAWFSEFLNYNFIHEGQAMSFQGIRFTGILEKRGDKWLLVQSHLSIPGGASALE